MRAPILGGSELETATIVRRVRSFRHEVIFPEEFQGMGPSITDRFPAGIPVNAVSDVEDHLRAFPPDLVHVQFPFILHPHAPHLESVLIFRGFETHWASPVLFTVHAAVNIPVVSRIHDLFHTEALAARFAGKIEDERMTVAPSLIDVPKCSPGRRPRDRVHILWVSRSEDAKFSEDIPAVVEEVHCACPEAILHFIGHPTRWSLPEAPWSRVESCPVADLEAAYRNADLFWYYPTRPLHETWCRTVTEAMAHALPCVVGGHGALPVQVRDGVEGRVVSRGDDAAAAIIGLVRDPALRLSMGRAARARGSAFAAEAKTVLAGLYDRLIGEHRRPKEPA